MADRLTRPNTRNPAGRIIEVQGVGQVEVGPEFFDLPREQQDQVVAEIMADYGRQQQEQPAAQQSVQEPAQEPEAAPDGAPQRLPNWAFEYAPTTAHGINELLDQGVGVIQGIGEVGDRAANLLEGAYNNTLGALFGDESTSADTPAFSNAAAGLGHGGEAGRLAGEMAGTALLTRGLGGPVAQGMGAGALFSDAETPLEFAGDVATGGAGGYAGERVARGTQALLAPAIDRGARMLHGAGVRMTPGQYLPALREFEDKSMSLPFAGPQLAAQRRQGFQDFARAVPRDALETLRTRTGRNIPGFADDATGQAAVAHTGDQISAVYEDVVPRLRLGQDPELVTDLTAVATRLGNEPLSARARDRFDRIIENSITSRLRGGVATGRQYEAVDTDLERQIARFARSDRPDDQMIAEGLQDIRATLRNAIVRQNGRLGQELEAADEAWSMLVPAEEAAGSAVRGFFSPAQYRAALRRGDNRVRRRGMARGEVRGQEFAEAGQDTLPSQMPNPSGTASHEAYSFANPRFYQGLATRMLYGQPTQNALAVATIGRPAAVDPLARAIANAINPLPAPQAGALGALSARNALLGF